MNSQTYTIQMLYRPTNFWSTVVKLYYTKENTLPDITITVDHPKENTITVDHPKENTIIVNHYVKQGHGHPRGSKNKQYLTTLKSFLLAKEKGDLELSLKLQQDGIISDPSLPFQASNKKEIDSLVTRGVFAFEQFDDSKHRGECIFKSRIV